jgi:hypothetical protein
LVIFAWLLLEDFFFTLKDHPRSYFFERNPLHIEKSFIMFIFGLKDATFILKANILSLIKVFKLAWTFIVEVGMVCWCALTNT